MYNIRDFLEIEPCPRPHRACHRAMPSCLQAPAFRGAIFQQLQLATDVQQKMQLCSCTIHHAATRASKAGKVPAYSACSCCSRQVTIIAISLSPPSLPLVSHAATPSSRHGHHRHRQVSSSTAPPSTKIYIYIYHYYHSPSCTRVRSSCTRLPGRQAGRQKGKRRQKRKTQHHDITAQACIEGAYMQKSR